MNEIIENYLSSLDRKMFWMSGKIRKDIVREIRSHLSERVSSGESPGDVISSFGSPDAVAREYLRIYGFGFGFMLALCALAVVLSALTVPGVVIVSSDYYGMDWASLVFLVITILFVLIIAYKGGRKAGVIVGMVGCVMRFIVLGVLLSTGAAVVQDGILGAIGFAIISFMLPIIGYLSSVRPLEKESGI